MGVEEEEEEGGWAMGEDLLATIDGACGWMKAGNPVLGIHHGRGFHPISRAGNLP